MSSIHPIDTDFHFPDFTLVSASAGTGKTHTLTMRYLQFILSGHIPGNKLRNILAITFTNSAAREMKQRILDYLEKAATGDPTTVRDLREIPDLNESELRDRAHQKVDYLLENYSEFQVQTIDSFLSRVFRASSLEFGFSPGMKSFSTSAAFLSERSADSRASTPFLRTRFFRKASLDKFVKMNYYGGQFHRVRS